MEALIHDSFAPNEKSRGLQSITKRAFSNELERIGVEVRASRVPGEEKTVQVESGAYQDGAPKEVKHGQALTTDLIGQDGKNSKVFPIVQGKSMQASMSRTINEQRDVYAHGLANMQKTPQAKAIPRGIAKLPIITSWTPIAKDALAQRVICTYCGDDGVKLVVRDFGLRSRLETEVLTDRLRQVSLRNRTSITALTLNGKELHLNPRRVSEE